MMAAPQVPQSTAGGGLVIVQQAEAAGGPTLVAGTHVLSCTTNNTCNGASHYLDFSFSLFLLCFV